MITIIKQFFLHGVGQRFFPMLILILIIDLISIIISLLLYGFFERLFQI